MSIPCLLFFGCHGVVHVAPNFFQTGCRMDFVLFICHFQIVDQIHILEDAHLLGCSSLTAFIIVVEVVWQRESFVAEKLQILQIRHPGTMRSLVMKQEAERFTLVALILQPFDSFVGDNIRRIPFRGNLFAVLDKRCVVINTLSDQDFRIIKSSGGGGQVPFPDNCCLVSGFL